MRKLVIAVLLFLAAPGLAQTLTTSDPDGSGPFPAGERVAGRVVVDFRGTPTPGELKTWGQLYGADGRMVLESHGLATLTVDEDRLPGLLEQLAHDPLLETFAPDYWVQSHSLVGPESLAGRETTASFPNDPRFKEQWHHQMVGATKAWKKASGKGVVVAVVDSGIAYKNKGQVRPVEDLAQTHVIEGYDFVNDDPLAVDDCGYGTHVAGTVAQSTNNKVGVAGLAYEATLMPVKVLNHKGGGSFGDIAAGIRFAADNGAQILLMGFGSSTDSAVLEEAIEYAHSKGCVLVGSAGVRGDETPGFPAEYDQVIAVGAVDRRSTVTNYSNRGVDMVAPGGYVDTGEGILQNTIHAQNPKRAGYLWFAGNNSSAAHVAAAAALVMSTGVTDSKAVREILLSTAKSKRDKKSYGAGILQADKAVQKAAKAAAEDQGCCPVGGLLLLGLFALVRRRRK